MCIYLLSSMLRSLLEIVYQCDVRLGFSSCLLDGRFLIVFLCILGIVMSNILSYQLFVLLFSVMSTMVSANNKFSTRLFLQLFVEGSCLIYVICVSLLIVVSNTYCVVLCLLCLRLASCVLIVASFYGLSIFGCPFRFL